MKKRSDVEWREFKNARFAELDIKKATKAATMLQVEFKKVEILEDLYSRIQEDPAHWLGGRKNAICWMCDGNKWRINTHTIEREDPCRVCEGSGQAQEMPLHHGWGTGVRNLLRKNGFNEEFFNVSNLDDYYAQLVELAVAQEYDVCLHSLTNPAPSDTSAKKPNDLSAKEPLPNSPDVIPPCTEITTNATSVMGTESTSPKTRIGVGIAWTLKIIRTWLVYPKKNGT